MNQPRIVFLYTELAGYIRSAMELLASQGFEVHVMAYPVNPEAPFTFDEEPGRAVYYQRSAFDRSRLEQWLASIDPQVIVCSGWVDRDYLHLCRRWRRKALTVLALDNPHYGGLRSLLSTRRARLLYKPLFGRAWVPGAPQVAFARAMGFARSEIHSHFYCADTRPFRQAFEQREQGTFARRFIFVGRYVGFKGVEDLWSAFAKMDRREWELHCAGTGPLYDQRPEMPGLLHQGFVQPSDLGTFVKPGGVFVLPSHREPWGVVVHEMAAAGLPIICSNAVGAASAFLEDGSNGYLFPSGDVEALKVAMARCADMSNEALIAMGRRSAKLAESWGAEVWLNEAKSLLEAGEQKRSE